MTRRLATCVFLLSVCAAAMGQELYSRQTTNLDLIYYDKNHEYLTYHLTRAFENSLAFQRQLFDYVPSEPVVLLMQDFGDYGHGGTSTVPWNYISIGIEPFDYVYETMPANERINWLMHHELVHVVATDKGADSDLFYRRLFRGKVAPVKDNPMSMLYSYLTSPRWYSPRWYQEGIAVFLETWMAGGLGRVLGGYDEMAFRTMVLENAAQHQIEAPFGQPVQIQFRDQLVRLTRSPRKQRQLALETLLAIPHPRPLHFDRSQLIVRWHFFHSRFGSAFHHPPGLAARLVRPTNSVTSTSNTS